MIHIIVWLIAGGLIAAGIAQLFSILLALLAVPFALLGDLGRWMMARGKVKRSHRDIAIEYAEKIRASERAANESWERIYFPEEKDMPASGSLDENGIPYL